MNTDVNFLLITTLYWLKLDVRAVLFSSPLIANHNAFKTAISRSRATIRDYCFVARNKWDNPFRRILEFKRGKIFASLAAVRNKSSLANGINSRAREHSPSPSPVLRISYCPPFSRAELLSPLASAIRHMTRVIPFLGRTREIILYRANNGGDLPHDTLVARRSTTMPHC